MARKRFTFKSSGKLVTHRDYVDPSVVKMPIGIKTPLEFGSGKNDEDFLKMHYTPAKQVKDNLKNLLMTGFGERLGNANLGPNLKAILYNLSDEEPAEQEAVLRIKNSIQRHLPMVLITDISIEFLGHNNSDLVKRSNGTDSRLFDSAGITSRHVDDSTGIAVMVVSLTYDIVLRGKSYGKREMLQVLLSCAG